jgi:hypothetical protein
MTRVSFSPSVFAIVGLLASAGAVSLGAQAAQGTRPRGAAPALGQAVPRTGTDGAGQRPAQAPQAQAPRSGPSLGAATPRMPPARPVEVPNAAAQPRPAPRAIMPRAVPRVVQPPVVQPQYARPQVGTLRPNDHRDYRPDYRPSYRPDYRPQYRSNYRPLYRPGYRTYYRPYYTFRPRVHLAFGLWVGYPVRYPTYSYPATPYPYAYTAPYPNAYPYPTGIYPAPGTGTAAVGAAGGLSFEISPAEAGVYVDGQYVGTVDQFSPDQPPLALSPGRHHVEIRAPGFEIISFDVDILPGQVIPYRGDLRRF